MRAFAVISFFCFLVALVVACLYWTMRVGFIDNPVLPVVKVIGTSAFILLLPIGLSPFRRFFSEASNNVFLNDIIIPIYGSLLILAFGYLSNVIGIDVSFIFAAAGYFFAYRTFLIIKKELKAAHVVMLTLLAVFFSFWVGPICWFWNLKPFFLESLAMGTDKVEALYQMASAQMIKTYNVGTTGLDGIAPMRNNWGSQIFFANLSSFLNISVADAYALCFPVIIGPLLFRCFLSFVIGVKKYFKFEEDNASLNFIFWFVFFAVFIGFFKSFLAGNSWAQFSTGGTGLTFFMLSSESYAISIIIMFAIFGLTFNFWMYKGQLAFKSQFVFLIFLLPACVAMVGFLKLPTLYIVCCLFIFFYYRLKLSRTWMYAGSVYILLIVSFIVFLNVFSIKDHNTGLYRFYFYSKAGISLFKFCLIFYIWTYIFILYYIIKEKLYKMSLPELYHSNVLIPIQCVVVASLAGILPTFFVMIEGYDALLFTEIQMWISAACVLIYTPFYTHTRPSKKKLLVMAIPCAVLLVIFFFNTKVYWRNLRKESVKAYNYILSEGDLNKPVNRYAINQLTLDSLYSKSKSLSFLIKLKELDKLPMHEKRQSLIYIYLPAIIRPNSNYLNLYCHNVAFVVPALSGMAMIDGIDVTYPTFCHACCEYTGYGYSNFKKWKTIEQTLQPETVGDLMNRVEKQGFKKLIYYDFETDSFKSYPL